MVVVGAAVVVVSGTVVVGTGAAVVVGSASPVQATANRAERARTNVRIETALLTLPPRVVAMIEDHRVMTSSRRSAPG